MTPSLLSRRSTRSRRPLVAAAAYLPRQSASRLTRSPTFFFGITMHCCVWAMSIKLNHFSRWFTSHTVRLVPSTAMYPFGTTKGKSASLNEIFTHKESPSFLNSKILPASSTWPCTKWPEFRSPAAMERSMFTRCPISRSPRSVRRSVSGAQLTSKVWASKAVTVRQVPFTAMLQPMYAPCKATLHLIFRTKPSDFDPSHITRSAFRSRPITVPISSTMPVKTMATRGDAGRATRPEARGGAGAGPGGPSQS
mmetsp:Transcript_84964/g.236503  ORF Transcript_84964/g.236503 Transcript_84964/m.236503 type:complete len:252 (+) Transcript_84964:322-1077(+)